VRLRYASIGACENGRATTLYWRLGRVGWPGAREYWGTRVLRYASIALVGSAFCGVRGVASAVERCDQLLFGGYSGEGQSLLAGGLNEGSDDG
jgi:hypothetical protein